MRESRIHYSVSSIQLYLTLGTLVHFSSPLTNERLEYSAVSRTFFSNLLEIKLKIWYNTNRHRNGRYLAENRTSSYQQIHAHKPLFGNQGRLLDLGHLYFDIVSPVPECRRQGDLELRISDFASLGIFTLVKNPLQISSFMQNKANFQKSQVNVTSLITVAYENKSNWTLGENKPNTNPIKANTKPIKPNTKPKQTQSNPISNGALTH